MKRCSLFALLSLMLGLAVPQIHAAGIPINLVVDEFGNGTADLPSGLHPLPSALLGPDPSGGLGVPVLVYALPFTPVAGDLLIDETIGAVPVLSDVVRFFGNFLIFYSDNGDGVDAPADTGLPGSLSTNVVSGLEVGPEGNNGFVYAPTAGQPGYISTDFAPTYNIISDSPVPEPGAMALLAVGLAGLGLLKRKRVAKR